jgi:hypothetical protein
MKKITLTSLAFLIVCIFFISCKKSGIDPVKSIEPVQKTSFLSSAKNRVALANTLKTYFGQKNTASRGSSNGNGAQFTVPFFSGESQGIGKFDFANFRLELASFSAELTSNDFYRKNLDGTYSVHVSSNNALAEYFENLFDPAATYLYGNGANFSADYTGNLIEFPFYDANGNLIFVFRFIDTEGSRRAVSVHGIGNVGPDGMAPWKKLSFKAVVTPGGQIQTDFILK